MNIGTSKITIIEINSISISLNALLRFIFIITFCFFFFEVKGEDNLSIKKSTIQVLDKNSDGLAELNEYLNHIESFGFSGQVLVGKGSEIIFNKAYGFADRIKQIDLKRNTQIGIASISKQFYAAAILKLVGTDKLSVTDKISKFFNEVPEDKKDITIHQILIHTSGMYISNDDDYGYLSPEELKNELFNNELKFEPGSSWQYSGAYSLLPMIIEKVTGLHYQEFMENELFKPAGIKCSFEGTIKENTAKSYLGFKENGDFLDSRINYRNYGRGDIFTSAEDLYKWYKAIQNGTVLSQNSREVFFDMQYPLDENNGYGYGWFIHKGDRLVIEHGGDAALGHNGSIFIYPDDELVVIVLSNSRDLEGNYLRHLVTGKVEKLLLEKTPIDASMNYPNETLPVPNNFYGSYKLTEENYLHILSDGAFSWMIPEGIESTSLFLDEKYHSEEWLNGFDTAKHRTSMFLKEAQVENIDNLNTTIGGDETTKSSALNYQNGFDKLVEALGPLHQFKITGSVPFRNDVFTRANLQFRDGEVNMTFFWSEKGIGRLMGNSNYNKTKFQKGFPVRFDKENNQLIAVDIWRNEFYIFSVEGSKIVLNNEKVYEKL